MAESVSRRRRDALLSDKQTVPQLHASEVVVAIDADAHCVTLMARSSETFKNGRFKRFFTFQSDRSDPHARIKVPRWLLDALKRDAVKILVEGGRDGAVWREFSAWCDESSKEIGNAQTA